MSAAAAAEAHPEERGVVGFTLAECARRAGVSKAAMAHHFGKVRGLLRAIAMLGLRISWTGWRKPSCLPASSRTPGCGPLPPPKSTLPWTVPNASDSCSARHFGRPAWRGSFRLDGPRPPYPQARSRHTEAGPGAGTRAHGLHVVIRQRLFDPPSASPPLDAAAGRRHRSRRDNIERGALAGFPVASLRRRDAQPGSVRRTRHSRRCPTGPPRVSQAASASDRG